MVNASHVLIKQEMLNIRLSSKPQSVWTKPFRRPRIKYNNKQSCLSFFFY